MIPIRKTSPINNPTAGRRIIRRAFLATGGAAVSTAAVGLGTQPQAGQCPAEPPAIATSCGKPQFFDLQEQHADPA